jgi:hypothetical protein
MRKRKKTSKDAPDREGSFQWGEYIRNSYYRYIDKPCTFEQSLHISINVPSFGSKATHSSLINRRYNNTGACTSHCCRHISLFALQLSEPSDGCLALRKLMANGWWMANEIGQCRLFSARKSVNECVITHGPQGMPLNCMKPRNSTTSSILG